MSTVFEKLLSGEWPCAKVYEDDRIFETLLDMDEDTAAALMRAAWKIARAVQAAFEPEGITVLQANRPAGWQTVPHAHLHVLPRYAGDGVDLTWPRKEPGLDRLHELAARIRV